MKATVTFRSNRPARGRGARYVVIGSWPCHLRHPRHPLIRSILAIEASEASEASEAIDAVDAIDAIDATRAAGSLLAAS